MNNEGKVHGPHDDHMHGSFWPTPGAMDSTAGTISCERPKAEMLMLSITNLDDVLYRLAGLRHQIEYGRPPDEVPCDPSVNTMEPSLQNVLNNAPEELARRQSHMHEVIAEIEKLLF